MGERIVFVKTERGGRNEKTGGKYMKKIRLLALILCMVAATACFFACGKPGTSESAGSTGGSDTIRMSEIGLDLFEDKKN